MKGFRRGKSFKTAIKTNTNSMNIEKLQQIANHIKTIDQKHFDMENVWQCVVGHSYKTFGDKKGNPCRWFNEFMEFDENKWALWYIVHSRWQYIDNSVEGAIKRIEHVIAWLNNPVRDSDYFEKIMRETFPNSF